jgi:hypothetical protein
MIRVRRAESDAAFAAWIRVRRAVDAQLNEELGSASRDVTLTMTAPLPLRV